MLKVLSGLFFISIRMTKGIEETHDLGKYINLKRNTHTCIHSHNSGSMGNKNPSEFNDC